MKSLSYIKCSVIIAAIFMSCANALAQTQMVRNSESNCVGATQTLEIISCANCTAFEWNFFGPAISQVTQSGSSISFICTQPGDYEVLCFHGGEPSSSSITFSIGNSVTPQVTITRSPSTTPIAFGTPVTFTATNVNGGSSPNYNWYVNNSFVLGQFGSQYTNSTLQNGDQVYVKMYSSLPCPNPALSNSNVITVNVSYPISAPIVSSATATYNTSTVLTASGAGASEVYRWYDAPTQGSYYEGLTYPVTLLNHKDFYVSKRNTVNNSESARVKQSVTVVVPPPDAPALSTNTCGGKILTRGTPPPNVVWYWQGTVQNGSSTASSGPTYTIDYATEKTYYLRAKATAANIWSNDVAFKVTTDPVDLIVTSYQPQNSVVQASHSITLGPGFVVSAGNAFTAKIAFTAECNDLYNRSEQIIYDQNGQPLSRARSYVSGLGEPLQDQIQDKASGKIWVTQPLYDNNNVASASTLPAPISENDFLFKRKFITNSTSMPYAASDFDLPTTINNSLGEIKNPKPVDKTIPYSLGWYYSNNNTIEPNTPTTAYPYARSYTPPGPDPVTTKSAGVGDQYKMGSDNEATGDRLLLQASELSHYFFKRSQFVPNSSMVYSGTIGYKYISTDPDEKMTVSFIDGDGRALASAVITNGSKTSPAYDYWSYNYYNDMGQLVASVAPQGITTTPNSVPLTFITTYKYDQLGRLIETTSSDEGTSKFVYSTDGKIRFSQNQEQYNSGNSPQRFSYTNYDKLGRLIESGEYISNGTNPYIFQGQSELASGNSVLNIIDNVGLTGVSQKLDAVRCGDYSLIEYDVQAADLPTGDADHTQQSNLIGQVSKTQNANATTWYSYDEFGHLAWSKQSLPDIGYKTVDYTYDYYGNVTQVIYQKNQPDKFYHFYSYDVGQRLSEVYTSLDGTTKTLQAKYYYYLHGPLKRIELASNLQGIDYTYTLQGALKSINHMDVTNDPGADGLAGTHSNFSKDVFGLTLSYFDNDFASAGHKAGNISPSGSPNNYDGTIKSVGWFTPVDNTPAKRAYAFTYDNLNQLQSAQWGTVTGTAGDYTTTLASSAYKEGVGATGYDKNGNIQTMTRNNRTGNSIGNYKYDYELNTNRLDKVNELSGAGSVLVDYTYNTIGQMKTYQEAGNTYNVYYNAYGLVTKIEKQPASGSPILVESFLYDDRGDRIAKINYDNNGSSTKLTFYVHDVSGNVLATYEKKPSGSPVLVEVPIYGAGRLGEYKPGKTTFYELNDHLGNVRAVIGAPFTETITATMESENTGTEDKQFKNIAPRTQVSTTPPSPNKTPGGNEAIYLNNSRPVGPATILKVSPGDVITIDTYAYYENATGYSNTLTSSVVMSSIISAFGGVSGAPGDPGKIFNALNTAFNGGSLAAGLAGSGNDIIPAAYLNMIMFDGNMLTDPATFPMSAIPVTGAANTSQHLTIGPITIPSPGTIYIYVNNNSNSASRVYFDDLTITQLHSPFVAGGDYYPYGLTMEDRQIKIEPYRYGYQGQYAEKDSVTGWNSFELRMYDARFGRWLSPDPYGQYASPYLAMGNNPASSTDPDGGWCCGGKIISSSAGKAVAGSAAREAGKSMTTTILKEVVVRSAANGYGVMAQASRVLVAESMFAIAMGGTAATSRGDENFSMEKPNTNFFYDGIANSGQSLSEWKPSLLEQWGNATGFIGSTSYAAADAIFVTASTLIPGHEIRHLDGRTLRGGDQAEALATTVATFMPFGPRGGNQVHHVIPQQLFFELNLSKYGFKLDHLKNLFELPTPFHGNHPAYTRYVRNEIGKLQEITLEGLIDIQTEMTKQIQRIHSSGAYERLNHYYKYTLGL